MKKELLRKLFHFTGIVYVAGLLFLPRDTFLKILLPALALEYLFEMLRLKNNIIGKFIKNNFGTIIREKEENKITGTFWMMLGVLVTAFLVEPPQIAATVISYLIFGDGIASLVGKYFKGPHWGQSSKRISGSLGCFLACLVSGLILMGGDYHLLGIVLGAVAAVGFELLPLKLDDNFTIPVGSALVMMLIYNLKPIFT